MEKWIFVNNITSLDKLYYLTKTINENVVTENNHAIVLMDALNANGANRNEANNHPINYTLFYDMAYFDGREFKVTPNGKKLLDEYNLISNNAKYKAEFFFSILNNIKYPNVAVETSDVYRIHPINMIFKLLCDNRLNNYITIDEFENFMSIAHTDEEYEKVVNIILKYRNGIQEEVECEKIAQVSTVVAGWCNQFNVMKKEGERIMLSDDLKTMLPILSDKTIISRLPYSAEFISFVLKRYFFDGASMDAIENEFYNSQVRRGFLTKDVLDYYQINNTENKAIYRGKSLDFVYSLLEIQSDERYTRLLNALKGIEELQDVTEETIIDDEQTISIDDVDRIEGGYNKIFYGIPGSGKSYTVDAEFNNAEYKVFRTTFHPEYTNSDFIGQIIPMVNDSKVKYEFHSGPFTLALKYALENKDKKVCLIIEEINRGNASAVFGDIFQLLDRNQIGRSKYEIYNGPIIDYLKENGINMEKIYLPSNMWIISTMNTSDQNVFTLDTAFKRRWKMEYIKNVFADNEKSRELRDKLLPLGEKYPNVTWGNFVTKINRHIISDTSGINSEDKQLGMYFVSIEEIDNPKEFAEKILSYLWEDVAKLNTSYWFGSIASYDELIEAYNKNTLDVFNSLFDDEIIKITDDITIETIGE